MSRKEALFENLGKGAERKGEPIIAFDCDWLGNRILIDKGLAKPFK